MATNSYDDSAFEGGYGSGGTDIGANVQTDGNVTADGNVAAVDGTFSGDLNAGVNKAWLRWLGAQELNNVSATVARATYTTNYVDLPVLEFSSSALNIVTATLQLPNYDAAGLALDILWAATTGTSGDTGWLARMFNISAGAALNGASGANNRVFSTFVAQNQVVMDTINLTPDVLSAGDFFTLWFARDGANAGDTFDGTAQLIGLGLRYA